MVFRLTTCAALIASAAFVFVAGAFAQAPIVDASVDSGAAHHGQPASSGANPNGSNSATDGQQPADNSQGELFYQLQLLQQDVMQLRGQVEEQTHQLQQLKEQDMQRYIDLDRRIGVLSGSGAATPAAGGKVQPAPAKNSSAKVARSGEREAYDNAYGLVVNKQFDAALKAFKQFLVDYPDGKYAPNSYYWMGELYQVITPSNLEAARESFTQLLTQYPENPKAPDAMYKLGKVYFLLGNKDASRKWLGKVIAQYGSGPYSSAADKARQFLNANF